MQPLHWRKSSYSGDSSNCVETARTLQAVHVRDSKAPTGTPLTFPPAAWARFISSAARQAL
ncbi:DUF397 domain-containing protein [Streptomyces sp. NPDC004065]|uniref:DUF397 domain-containing protein n=1 Tax=Streptomyces sp. NPDC004065 TaxID=3364689 RepID=UPI00384FCA37